jgi:hypothetical protein
MAGASCGAKVSARPSLQLSRSEGPGGLPAILSRDDVCRGFAVVWR